MHIEAQACRLRKVPKKLDTTYPGDDLVRFVLNPPRAGL
jgi:hypothetical protein